MDGRFAEQFRRADAIFDAALDRDVADRARYVEQACGDDAELLAAVHRLLLAHEASAEFLDRPAPEQAAQLLDSALRESLSPLPSPHRLGPYRVGREVGRGGMGTVYLGERDDGQFQQRVALKVARAGLGADHLVQRFLRERRILASLEHPHIARLIDGGVTPHGMPWFAMEFVEGQPITRYSVERRLTLRERLRLFRDVCAAVHYAHEAGVVHRDVKPGNILVTSDGTVKLLDFGIAKLLDPKPADPEAATTRTAHVLLTPEYAAPEQIRGELVTPASDVYALGVLLYELLAGDRPYRVQAHSPGDIERMVCEIDPPRPSVAVRRTHGEWRRLHGDLDTIVMKALQKQPERRYASVAALLEDLDRFAQSRPVLARPDTVTYRAGRYVRRNRRALLVAVVIPAMAFGPAIAYVRHNTTASPPAGGMLANQEPLVVADFDVEGSDSSTGRLLADALRLHVEQSSLVSVMPRDRVMGALRLLGDRQPGTQLDVALAREIAQREGVRAVVAGNLTRRGEQHLVRLRLIAASSGEELASFEERVTNPERDLLPALGRLVISLRRSIGESLRDVRSSPVLDPVTTASLDALRKYTEARRSLDGNASRAVTLLREAVAIDTSFAMAYVILASHLQNAGVRAGRDSAISRAYTLRERVTPRERTAIETLYFQHVLQDRPRAAATYEAQIARDSSDLRSIINYGALLVDSRQLARAESHHRSFEGMIGELSGRNFVAVLLGQGKVTAAESTAALALAARPDNPGAAWMGAAVEVATLRFDSAAGRMAHVRSLLSSPLSQLPATRELVRIARVRGRLTEASRLAVEERALDATVGAVPRLLRQSLAAAQEDLWIRAQPARAAGRLDAVLAAHPAASLSALDDYEDAFGIAAVYAASGRPERAREIVKIVLQTADARTLRATLPHREAALAEISLAEDRPAEAMASFRRSDVAADGLPATACGVCIFPGLARAAERAGLSDSARTFWEEYVNTVSVRRLEADSWFLATAYRRLAELYARAGEHRKAADYERRFIALWQDADMEFEPQVQAANQRLARLQPGLAQQRTK